MQQNATAAGALLQCSESRWSSGLYNAFPDPLAGFKGSLRGVEGRRQREGEGEPQVYRRRRRRVCFSFFYVFIYSFWSRVLD